MEQDKTNGHMRNGAALARKPVTSIAERRPNKERSGGCRDISRYLMV